MHPASESPHFGSVLRRAREERSVSIDAVAEAIKVSRSCLRMIEAAELDDLPPAVYVRGFVKAYARCLGIAEEAPLALFDAQVADREAARAQARMPAAPILADALGDGELLGPDGLAGELREEDASGHRSGVGLAIFVVIVLVIATITVTYLMRQPPAPGEGLSWLAPAGDMLAPLTGARTGC